MWFTVRREGESPICEQLLRGPPTPNSAGRLVLHARRSRGGVSKRKGGGLGRPSPLMMLLRLDSRADRSQKGERAREDREREALECSRDAACIIDIALQVLSCSRVFLWRCAVLCTSTVQYSTVHTEYIRVLTWPTILLAPSHAACEMTDALADRGKGAAPAASVGKRKRGTRHGRVLTARPNFQAFAFRASLCGFFGALAPGPGQGPGSTICGSRRTRRFVVTVR